MSEDFRLVVRPRVGRRVQALSAAVDHDPKGPAAPKLATLLEALDAVAHGREEDYAGKRLGNSGQHIDLRDCAEIKVAYVQEYRRDGSPLGPSHRLIYREFDPPSDSRTAIREVICFGPRADGRVFEVAGQELQRTRTTELDTLRNLPNSKPAVGPNMDPDRPISPVRLPLTPEVAAALMTTLPRRRADVRRAPVPIDRPPRRLETTRHQGGRPGGMDLRP